MKVTDAEGEFESFTYNGLYNLQDTATDKNQNPPATFTYNIDGNVQTMTDPDDLSHGTTFQAASDAAGWVTGCIRGYRSRRCGRSGR